MNNDMKIIYLFEQRHGYEYDYDMFGMKFWEESNCQVEVWSVVNWKYGKKIQVPKREDKSGRTKYIDSYQQLCDQLNKNKGQKMYFLCYAYNGYDDISYVIRKCLSKNGYRFSNITYPLDPTCDPLALKKKICWLFARQVKYCLANIISYLKRKETYEELRKSFARLWGPLLYRSEYNFLNTEMDYFYMPCPIECYSKKNICIHSSPYDEYLTAKCKTRYDSNRYILFIDEYMTGHSDFIKSGCNFPAADKERYFSYMQRFFDRLEEDLQAKVIVAAHPKAEYYGDEFGEREIVYGKTNLLIKDALLVVDHMSTCIGVVCLFGKDFITVYADQFFENVPFLKDYFKTKENLFARESLCIDRVEDVLNWQKFLVVGGETEQKNYIKKYVISENGEENRFFYEVIRDKILNKV